MGHSERDLRVRHSRRPPAVYRSAARGAEMIDLHWLYVLAGAIFLSFAIGSARDSTNPKRWGNAAFWSLLAVSFWCGDLLGDIGNGILVLALVALAGPHLLRRGAGHSTSAEER